MGPEFIVNERGPYNFFYGKKIINFRPIVQTPYSHKATTFQGYSTFYEGTALAHSAKMLLSTIPEYCLSHFVRSWWDPSPTEVPAAIHRGGDKVILEFLSPLVAAGRTSHSRRQPLGIGGRNPIPGQIQNIKI